MCVTISPRSHPGTLGCRNEQRGHRPTPCYSLVWQTNWNYLTRSQPWKVPKDSPAAPQHPPPQNPAVSRPRDRQVGVDQVSLSAWQLRGVKVAPVRWPEVSAAKSSPHTQPGAHRGQHRSPSCLPFVVLFLPFSRLL